MKVTCLMNSTAGKIGEVKEFSDNRAKQLIDKKIAEEFVEEVVEEVVEEKTETKKKAKK